MGTHHNDRIHPVQCPQIETASPIADSFLAAVQRPPACRSDSTTVLLKANYAAKAVLAPAQLQSLWRRDSRAGGGAASRLHGLNLF
jgi:hypothetical protein